TGDKDPHYRREYLCEIIRDKDSVVIPEFTPEKEKDLVVEMVRPPFYDIYVSGDVGFRDLTIYLFGYWDFKNATLVVIDELVMNGPEMTTEKLAQRIREKEEEHFSIYNDAGEKVPEKVYMRVMDNNLIMVNDLNRLHGLNFIPTAKDDKEAQINQVRMMISNNQIKIHPRCKHLIYHLKHASWKEGNSSKRIFANLSDSPDFSIRGGHADAVDALIYMVRNLIKSHNPYPEGWDKPKGNDVFYGYYQEIKHLEQDQELVSRIKQILNIKG
ncbi:MAG: hypothetical protein R3321_12935, partial [Nitrososphaeraceae archaeon]|nr:hypothetical protein [Nitrososphaeraceae archaeon]